ncbi:MAG TPA: tRNA adenosine(34) deaminase TadA [Candidatus Binataceae bacterium]|nr:tRNA adenosine(34) deaminase TadA [Candidatus Binataceae bacterium]
MDARDFGHERFAEYERRLAEMRLRHTFGEAAMRLAIEEAERGAREGEVPIGAIVVADDKIVGAAHNLPIAMRDPTAHAEVLAIRDAASNLDEYRLVGASIYVTIEPCVMCVGAIINARIARVYYGARDEKAGAMGSIYDIGRDGRLNHRVEAYGGIMAEECARVMRDFFASRRRI